MFFKAIALGLALFSAGLRADFAATDIDYRDGKAALQGHAAFPGTPGMHPGVLIVHQWMGLTDYEKGRAQQLAALGYVVLAADIYGKGVRPADLKAAAEESSKYKNDRALFRSRLSAGIKALSKLKGVDRGRLAVIGYCFGGTGALEAARSGADLKGVVSFHGGLDSPGPAHGRAIKARVLILHGDADPFVRKPDLEACLDELRAAKVDFQFTAYSGAVHAFTQPGAGNDPSKGAAYDGRADKRSWLALKSFLEEVFAKP